MDRVSILLLLSFFLSSCIYVPSANLNKNKLSFPEKKKQQQNAPPIKIQTINAGLINILAAKNEQESQPPALKFLQKGVKNWEYRVGINDILSFVVWDHPELTIPAGENRQADATGNRVQADGTIFFPYIGKIIVKDLTLDEVRQLVTKKLSSHIRKPQLDVHVVGFRSQWIHITGAVKTPGKYPITDVPMTLVEALNRAGNELSDSEKETADLTRVRLTRNNKHYNINIYSLLRKGDVRQNILLQSGDALYVPDRLDKKVFILGEVGQPDILIISNRGMSLADALGKSGGVKTEIADARKIYIIRSYQKEGQPNVYLLDATDPVSLVLSTRFKMKPRDIIYVETSGIIRWNTVWSRILPTLGHFDTIKGAVLPVK